MTDDDSWPVGGTRLRPTFRNDSSWDGIGHVPADWENAPVEQVAGSDDDDDWEKLLAKALGITESGRPTFTDADVDAPADRVLPFAFTPEPMVAPAPDAPLATERPATEPLTPTPAGSPADTILPWAGDDILPNRDNRHRRRRFFRR